ncbi:MAG: U32 family peptidase, partial [Lachnospiraceae bacterium]|nr:U32 family peptidase [Lachnospiraceae bacterium]
MSGFELLAPAGSIESLKAAVNAGADAVYIGGAAFGARAYADNPEEDALIEGIRYCHVRNKKVYLTVNTLFKEDELENRLFSFLRPYYEAGLDAVIVQDIGAVSFINDHFPGLPIHLSTQTSVTMAEGAALLKDSFENITRVVPARELSAAELRRFKDSTSLEIEVFIHGALCYCYSGQCLMSSMIGGRSGNRGRCAQPCRRMYDGKYLLSPKDQCLLPVLHELLDIGIDSFKIEGRMKSPEYTAGVVSVYRRYIDKYEELGSSGYKKWLDSNKAMLDADMLILQDLYNRGGFNRGYPEQHNGPDMMTFDRPNHTGTEVGEVITVRGREAVIRFKREVFAQDVLEIRDGNKNVFEFTLGQGFASGSTFSCITMKDRKAAVGMPVFRTRPNSLLASIRADYIEKISKVPVRIAFKGRLGEAAELTVTAGSTEDAVITDDYSVPSLKQEDVYGHSGKERINVTIKGGVIEPAQKAPSDAASVIKQLSKLGETDFCVAGEIEVELDENVFIPSGELNRMRREAAEALRERLIKRFEREPAEECESTGNSAGNDNYSQLGKVFSVWSESALDAVVNAIDKEKSYDVYYNLSNFDTTIIERLISKLVGNTAIRLYIGLPYISRSADYDRMKPFIDAVMKSHPSVGFIARTREEISLL